MCESRSSSKLKLTIILMHDNSAIVTEQLLVLTEAIDLILQEDAVTATRVNHVESLLVEMKYML